MRRHAIGTVASAGIVETERRGAAPGLVDEQHCRGALPFVVRSGHAPPA
jgi:hypothetical protein